MGLMCKYFYLNLALPLLFCSPLVFRLGLSTEGTPIYHLFLMNWRGMKKGKKTKKSHKLGSFMIKEYLGIQLFCSISLVLNFDLA